MKLEYVEVLPSGRVGIYISGIGMGEIMLSPESAKDLIKLLECAIERAQEITIREKKEN